MVQITQRKWFKEMDKVEIKAIPHGCYRGTYDPKKVIIFVDATLPIKQIARTVLHEAAHHIQYRHLKTFIRYKGVCHDDNFWTIFARLALDISLRQVLTELRPYPYAPGWTFNTVSNEYEKVKPKPRPVIWDDVAKARRK